MATPLSARPLQTAATPWWAQRWPWLLMLGPFLVVLAASYSGWLAFTREDALVEDNYYQQGLAINQELQRDHVASVQGLSALLQYDPASGILSGQINRTTRTPQRLMLQLAHATRPELDIKLVLQPDAGGRFSVALPQLERSRWQVLLENERRDWRLRGSWSWPAQRDIQLRADRDS